MRDAQHRFNSPAAALTLPVESSAPAFPFLGFIPPYLASIIASCSCMIRACSAFSSSELISLRGSINLENQSGRKELRRRAVELERDKANRSTVREHTSHFFFDRAHHPSSMQCLGNKQHVRGRSKSLRQPDRPSMVRAMDASSVNLAVGGGLAIAGLGAALVATDPQKRCVWLIISLRRQNTHAVSVNRRSLAMPNQP